jgi:hypothetical protein
MTHSPTGGSTIFCPVAHHKILVSIASAFGSPSGRGGPLGADRVAHAVSSDRFGRRPSLPATHSPRAACDRVSCLASRHQTVVCATRGAESPSMSGPLGRPAEAKGPTGISRRNGDRFGPPSRLPAIHSLRAVCGGVSCLASRRQTAVCATSLAPHRGCAGLTHSSSTRLEAGSLARAGLYVGIELPIPLSAVPAFRVRTIRDVYLVLWRLQNGCRR